MEILNYSFDGEGMQRVFENEKWTVGIKNWKPANDITGINNLSVTTRLMSFSYLLPDLAH